MSAVEDWAAQPPSDAPEERRVRLPKMAELVALDLRRRIIRNELAEGEQLPSEAVLMAQYGVSRPTLREAFRVLEAESLVVIQRGSRGGAKVQPPRSEVAARYAGLMLQYRGTTLGDVYEVRGLLEAPCAHALARRPRSEDVARLRRCIEIAEQPGQDPARVTTAHNEFHKLLVHLSGNQTLILLSELVQEIIDQANVSRAKSDSPTGFERTTKTTIKTHRRLTDLIEAGDAEGAEALWRKHLTDGAAYALGEQGASTALDVLQ